MTSAVFPDSQTAPSREQLLATLGAAGERWARLENFARDMYGLEGEAIYFQGDTGWCIRYRRSGKALFTMLPHLGGFRALVVVGPSAWPAAEKAQLSRSTRAKWDAAHPYHDGRWLYLDVADDDVAGDVEQLVMIKSPPPKRRRSPTA